MGTDRRRVDVVSGLFKSRGVTFTTRGAWRYAVCFRYKGNAVAQLHRWHDFETVTRLDTALHVFEQARTLRPGADTYLIDFASEQVLKHCHRGVIVHDALTPTNGEPS